MKRKQLPEPYAAKRHPKGALDKIDVGTAIAFDQARPIGHTAVRVILQTSEVLPFSSFFMSSPPVIRAEATAAAVTNGEYCVISLESTTATGITMQGNASVNMGCGLVTNSKAANAVVAGGAVSSA